MSVPSKQVWQFFGLRLDWFASLVTQVKVPHFHDHWTLFEVPNGSSDSPGWGLWEGGLCVEVLSSSLDGWRWRLKLCSQRGQQEGVKRQLLSQNPKAATMSCPAQGCPCWGTAVEEIYTAPRVCSLGTVSIVTLTSEHIIALWDTGLDTKEIIPANSPPKRPG